MIWGNPWFLFGLAGASAPILIHLLFRRKARRIRFPSLMLLRLVRKNITRYHHLREILLLAMRVLVIVLLALALARPFIPGFGKQGAAAIVFIVDDSLSMGQVCEGGSHFADGTGFARRILNGLGGDSRAGLVSASLRPRGSQELTSDLNLVREKLAALDITGAGPGLDSSLRQALQWLSDEKGLPGELYILSDRRAPLPPDIVWPEDLRVFYVDCYREARVSNIVVEDIHLPEGPFPEMSRIQIKITLHNAGTEMVEGRLGFSLAETGDSQELILEKGARTETVFQTLPLGQGHYEGRVWFKDDCVPGDSERFFTVEIGTPLRILFLDTDGTAGREDRRFITSALNPWGAGMNVFTFEQARPDLLQADRLREFDLVICPSFRPLVHARFSLLSAYVAEGGKLILMPSADYNYQAINRAWDQQGSFMPWNIREIEIVEEEMTLGRINFSYPGLAPLRNLISGENAHFSRRLALALDRTEAITVLAEFDDRLPAVVSNRFGKGEIVLFGWGPGEDWGDASYKNFYAPFMYKIARYLCGGRSRIGEYAAGTPVALPAGQPGRHIAFQIPGREGELLIDPEENDIFKDTFTPGHYQYTYHDGKARRSGHLIFNPDLEDSRTVPGPPETFQAAGTKLIRPVESEAERLAATRHGRQLKGWLLGAAIVLLLLELYLANSMGVRKWRARAAAIEKGEIISAAPGGPIESERKAG